MDVKFLIAGDRAVSVEFGSVISLEVMPSTCAG